LRTPASFCTKLLLITPIHIAGDVITQKNDLVKRALAQVEQIEFIPDWGKARLHAFIANRAEWCISRQRQWGVPIVALLCKKCDWAFVDSDFVKRVADRVAQEGIEYWDRITIEQLIADGLLHKDFACASCGNKALSEFRQERDILDVWFDSGASNYAVLQQDLENLSFPADLYLEGSDQHRGWFQSSLLCSMVLNDQAPMKAILTHGYVVDEQKRKMSKSIGNTVAPQEVIKKYSRDILRLWVASSDFQGDVVISEKLLQNVAEVYRKIRNTCRFLLSNLYDFDSSRDAVTFEKLPALDQYALAQLQEVDKKIRQAYEAYHFAGVFHALNNYCTNDLSAVYLDILKDRLYVEKADGHQRRSAQTVMYTILDTLTRLMAPILSFMAEELSDQYQKNKTESIHLQVFNAIDFAAQHRAWEALEVLRSAVLKSIEPLREQGVIKHSLEARVVLYLDPSSDQAQVIKEFIDGLAGKEEIGRFFSDWCIVSRVDFVPSRQVSAAGDLTGSLVQSEAPWLWIAVAHADGVKCPRCWHWEVTDHAQQLCVRCATVLAA
jgi:isoleucyl-tRNA synthetase